MNNVSNIRILKPSEFTLGLCEVCGENATIKFHCVASGTKLGACCMESFRYADAVLTTSEKATGIRHPQPGEAVSLPNS